MWRRRGLFCAVCFMFMVRVAGAAEQKEARNIIPDGGFEKVREVVIGANKHVYKWIQEGVDFGQKGGPIVILPSSLWGFTDKVRYKKFIVVEGTPGKEVHSGKRALYLSGTGTFYFKGARCEAKTGDVFKVSCYVKGKGGLNFVLHLTNTEGKYYAQAYNRKGMVVDSDKWTLVEQTLDTGDYPDLKRIWVRMGSKGDIYIDDVSLVKEGNQP